MAIDLIFFNSLYSDSMLTVRKTHLHLLFFIIQLFSVCSLSAIPEPEAPGFSGNLRFNYLTVNNGLSQNSITSIIQDYKGLIWIGSYDGLNRFDGFSTIVKRHDPKNPNSLKENRILCLSEGSEGKIWIGTEGGGVNIYDPDKDAFSHHTMENHDIPSNNIHCICSGLNGNIWIGTDSSLTLATTDPKGRINFSHLKTLGLVSKLTCDKKGNIWVAAQTGLYVIPAKTPVSGNRINAIKTDVLKDPYIYALFCDRFNNIWISTYNSLFQIQQKGKNWQEMTASNRMSQVFPGAGAIVRSMVEDSNGSLWLGTEQSGLRKIGIDTEGNISGISTFDINTPFCNISDNNIRALFTDRTNVLWIGFHKKGINYADICGKQFNLLTEICSPVMNELGYKSKFISSILCDSGNKVWLISEEEGIYVYNRKTRHIVFLSEFPEAKSISAVMESKAGDIWTGGLNALFKIDQSDLKNNRFHLKKALQLNSGGIIRTICEDLYGHIWFGSITGEGLCRFNPKSGELTSYHASDGISSGKMFYFLSDNRKPVIWAGTLDGGLIRVEYYPDNDRIKTTTFTTSGNFKLKSNHIWNLYQEQSGNLWIGTDAGLDKMEFDIDGNISSIRSIDLPLLSGIKIMAITEDLDHRFWLNCSQGLYLYDPQNEEVKIYTHEDGLQSNTFTEAASIAPDGWIFTGGINGANYFLPSRIKDNPYTSQVAIVNFRIHEKVIKPSERIGKRIILQKDINATEEITLDHRSNNFMFEYVAIHYAVTGKNQFRYMLEGFDKDWILTGSNLRVAAYSNLPAGKYTFKIKSSNNDGVWSDNIKEIRITILPPPWKTGWAYFGYILCILGLIYFVIHYLLTKQNLRHELQIERIEKEKISELNEMKMSFFTNITHEFRTPLALILSPLRDLLSEKRQNKHVSLRLQIINRNANRLLNLINQTLDIRKISSGNMSLLITPNNLHIQIENMIESFEFWAKDRQMLVNFTDELTADPQWYDKYKIDKVLLNILSNAFRHTPKRGNINIALQQKNENQNIMAVVSVRNLGKAIPPEELQKIFEPFYQAGNTTAGGTGIGLSYVKDLLEIHHGSIEVESNPLDGTCFTFRFPVNKEAFDPGLIKETMEWDDYSRPVSFLFEEEIENTPAEEQQIFAKESRKKILIVEDNVDLRMYIKDCLSIHYEIFESSNGETGLKTAREIQPDLIITDIMMPVMDGIEFCRTLKADFYTRHIPVFVHSVKSDESTFKEALDAGAEDFIGKPFNYSMLIKKIRNFFKTRELLVTRAQAEKSLVPQDITVPSSDEELIRKVSVIIEKNLSNSEFGVDILAKELGLSRMQLHRRIVGITGKQVSELIRDIRLQRAAQLLDTGEKRISEVMWETGFNNHSRFNKYFSEKFKMSVKDYIIEKQQGKR